MLNKVQLIGNLGADPEVRRLENGISVARLRLATSETYKDKDGVKQTITEWHSIVAWRGLAEVAEKYMHKGDPIYIEGKITTRKWQTDGGENRYTTEIKADNIIMLGKKDGAGSGRPPMPSDKDLPENLAPAKKHDEPMPGEGDDLPF